MPHIEELTGIVDHIIFHNEQNGFTVFVLQTARNAKTTIKGYAPTLHAGEQVTAYGSWISHPKFGKQFEAQQCKVSLPSTAVGIEKYLASGMIKGIGPVYAKKLVNKFGADVLEVIDKQPYRLHEVPGIGPKRVDCIIAGWQDQKEISHIMVFLQEKNISPTYAAKIYKKYGNNSITILQENPYKLADDIWGIGFKIADQIAQTMGFAPDGGKRISSGILYTLSTIIGAGHLYAELTDLKEKTLKLLELEPDEKNRHTLKLALHELYNGDRIKLLSLEEQHFVTTPTHYFSEKTVAQKIDLLLTEKSRKKFDTQKIYQKLRADSSATALNENQQKGILSAVSQKVTIITGGPGTGKTTTIKQLLSVLDEYKVRYKLAAPTGRAAKRITESTGRPAATLHRLLEFDISTMNFKHNEQNALSLDFLIIDEASMVDVFLAQAVLKAVPYYAHVVFIGDVDQLPSVGPGNILHDLIESGTVPTVRLTEIFRQAQNSMIIRNAHRINNGEFPTQSLPDARRDFYFIKEEDPAMVPHHLKKIYRQTLPTYHIKNHRSVVLVPMNRGSVGTQTLNDLLQSMLNGDSSKKEIMQRGIHFREGDRVMQIKNNYDKLVFNGDMGNIESVDTSERMLVVRFPDQSVTYEFNELDELVLAYATTIHKSQGSEFDAVIVPLFTQHFTLLQRNLIYTAITRAKKLCIFIGQVKAIAMAINNNKGRKRVTFLPQFLTSDLACR